MEEQMISIEEIFEALRKRWRMIVLITLVTTLISGIFSFFVISPVYEASTKLFVGKEKNSEEMYNSSDIQMYQKLLKTYSETIRTRDLLTRAIKDTRYDLNVDKVSKALTVVPVSDTQILEIKYRSKDPVEAESMIKSISNNFIKTAEELVPNGNVRVIESVDVPDKPVSPNKKMNIAIAFLLGLMVGIGLSFVLEYLDNTYKSREQLEKELGLPVLGVIPDLEDI